jgi:hypothetical protein
MSKGSVVIALIFFAASAEAVNAGAACKLPNGSLFCARSSAQCASKVGDYNVSSRCRAGRRFTCPPGMNWCAKNHLCQFPDAPC